MTKRAVPCSIRDCEDAATTKIAAPWAGGGFRELKTYGFACRRHTYEVLEGARSRAELAIIGADEIIGEIDTYPMDA